MLCGLLFLVFVIENAYAKGYYQAIGPKILRPESAYHISVTLEGTSQPTLVRAIVEGVSYNGSIVNIEDIKNVLPYSSQIFSLKIPSIPPGAYRLQVQGQGGLDFISYYPLDYLEKSYTVLIETDKAVYNPGAVVSFRVIVLDSQLKPLGRLSQNSLTIRALDGDSNIIKTWTNLTAKGVYTDSFKLSNNPVLGNWNLTVEIQGQEYFKTIRVAKYVLPGFRIDVETKEHVTFKEGKIVAKIKTNYHSGEKLEGEVTISAFPTIFSRVIQPIFQNPIRKVVQSDGSAVVAFDIVNDLKLNDEYERILVLDVEVEEKPNGRRENTSVKVHVHKYSHKIDLVKVSDFFKPGLKYTAYVKLSRHDKMPLSSGEEIVVKHGFSQVDEVPSVERKHRLDRNGLIKLEFLAPANVTNTTALRIEAQYGDLKERMSPVLAAVSYSNNFLQASLETDKPLVNLDVEISVTCTEPMKYLSYVVLGRGDVLLSKTIPVDNKKETMFTFRALYAMVPLAHLIVSYIRENGEMIGDTLDFEVDGLLQNFLEVRSSTIETEPGFDIDIQMKSQPYSFIGLMAVDYKNYLLEEGYQLSNSMVSDELYAYDSAKLSNYLKISKDTKTHFSWKPGGSNIYSGVEDSGADILTNAHILRKKPTLNDIYLRPSIYDSSTVKPDRGFGLPIHTVTRPPLAGPYAFSRIPAPAWNIPKVYMKEKIEDTWIFSNFSTRYDGVTTTRKKLPNSLTTWMMTGFSLDPVFGLGIMTPKFYKTSRSFFIRIDLPFSVHRGEFINVPVHLYNGMEKNVDCEVTMHNPDGNFEFTKISNEVASQKYIEKFSRKRISISAQSNGSVWFMITPLKLGSIEVKVSASNPSTQDSLSEYLSVEAEGEPEHYTKAELLDLRKTEYIKKQINFTIPKNTIPGSEKIEVAAVGNLFGPTLRNLDHVIRKPTGCGEQNLLFMMTSLIVLKYLRTAGQSMPQIREKAVEYLEESYQSQLDFKRKDGAFSAFGRKDTESSVWLTAYALMTLRQASEFIYIDQTVIEKGYEWLSKSQGRNGSFYEIGDEIHADMQNKSGNSLPLTAFVLISFLENQKYSSKYKNTINKGLDYIARYIDESEETYSIALCSYVMQLSRHPSKQSSFNLLDNKAKYQDSLKWWAKPQNDKNNPWNNQPRSVDIEMTSYALLSFLESNLIEDAMGVLNWLLKQQNDLGGFSSSQDTVVSLQALYKLVTKLSSPTNAIIEFDYTEKDSGQFRISPNDAFMEQRYEINKSSRSVNVTAKGQGLAVFKIYYQYNKDVTGPWPMFILDPQVDKISNRDHLQLSICIKYVKQQENATSEDETRSNMAVMEVKLPSGYTLDTHSLPSLEVSQHVEKVETKDGLTRVVLYFYNVSSAVEYCPTVSAFRTHKVANQKPVPVVLYDYYDTSRRARVFYRPPTTTVCDICTDIDCDSACVISPKPQIRESESSRSNVDISKANSTITFICLPILILINNLLTY